MTHDVRAARGKTMPPAARAGVVLRTERLARRLWGKGYGTEAATTALHLGFGECGLEEVVAFTAASNRRSRAVTERLGMSRDPRHDFEQPLVPEAHALRWHVGYRARRP